MILKIRTKDNLEELVRHRNSPSWVIAEYRENQIKKVEIYQFDGKKVLKADFDLIRSSCANHQRKQKLTKTDVSYFERMKK